MIEYKKGDMFTSKCQIIVCPTNSIGVMGKGLAQVFQKRYPIPCDLYNGHSKRVQSHKKEIELLSPYIDFDYGIMMFATKIHWRNPSKIEYLEKHLPRAIKMLEDAGITSCAWPLLGAGLGGLSVEDVKTTMNKYLSEYKGLTEIWEL